MPPIVKDAATLLMAAWTWAGGWRMGVRSGVFEADLADPKEEEEEDLVLNGRLSLLGGVRYSMLLKAAIWLCRGGERRRCGEGGVERARELENPLEGLMFAD